MLCQCRSDYLWRKLLEVEGGKGLNLEKTLSIAEQCEEVEAQMTGLSMTREEKTDFDIGHGAVNFVKSKSASAGRTMNTDGRRKLPASGSTGQQGRCYRCGKHGHYG